MKDENNDQIATDEQPKQRRKLITSIATISGVTAVSQWKKPIIDSVILPAHAQGSPTSSITTGNFGGSGSITTP